MPALVAANGAGALLFAALYAAAGARWLPQPAFLAALPAAFVLATALWLRAEARQRGRDSLGRVGRAVLGLAAVVLGVPVVVLLPLFWLETMLPPEAGLARALPPVMALVLISLALVVAVNLAGAVVIGVRAVLGGRPRAGPGVVA